ncbi:MAG: MFS transporter [Gammaproteobacteria bacterium]|nr:MFS transporter [Gammaproteobacteria bacterium]MDH3448302.1 MFS transporter [Gammaproteobacteria bacterium]
MERKPRPLIDLLLSIVIPSIILMKFSDADELGASGALVVALAFPVGLGLYELMRFRNTNYIALLGLISVLLTGGIGLLQLDAQWLAVKEAAIPALLGVAVLISARLGYPVIRLLLYNPKILDTERISTILRARGQEAVFENRLLSATYLLGATFFFSAVMNYLLASWIVVSPAGSAAFNEELGRLTLISYPVIAIPSMLMMLGIFYILWRNLHRLTGLALEEIMAPLLVDNQK